ncbi:hypothetical protein BCR43DRAFT_498466 [Syncephalastrum racemosum]|uniref:Yeast cell wall synthesis Kre9/Knh1-like N-terminal domain-containing protein n=1 Tax=Syncephalastrum racemosum TaxID=13706 RepID=A0A1X2H0X5_SYNRA|nr:hypothetical protein BCR43DRAFT_498466 [Syncephalastrum racemosum]
MKSSILTAFAIAASAGYAAADITVVTPWADSTWTAGGHGNITWKSTSADANTKCEIQLMNGNASNSNMVAYVTSPGSPVSCSADQYDIYPLNDFAAGKYWIRIGSNSTWAYSGVFNFKGNGTAAPLQLASNGGSSVAAAATAKSTAATTGKSSSSASASASHSGSADSGAASVQSTFVAVAGGAIMAALALAL